MLVSCIVPLFNVEDYITACYSSLKKQVYPDTELIFVDNNSTDNTLAVVKNLIKNDKNARVVSEKKQGASAARNHGLRLAGGAYVQFLDADDVIGPEKIARQIKLVLSEQVMPDLVVGNFTRNTAGVYRTVSAFEKDIWLGLMKTKLGCTCSNLWNYSKLMEVGGWNENLKSSQEYDLMFRFLKLDSRVVFDLVSDTVVLTRTSGNISSVNPGENMKRYCQLRLDILLHLKQQIKAEDMAPYYQVFFDALRMLARFDMNLATQYRESQLPADFVPMVSETTSKSYLLMYKILGFKLAEKLKGALS